VSLKNSKQLTTWWVRGKSGVDRFSFAWPSTVGRCGIIALSVSRVRPSWATSQTTWWPCRPIAPSAIDS